MTYYKIYNYCTWFYGNELFIHNLNNHETNVLEVKNYIVGVIQNTSIFKYTEWISLKFEDVVIEVDSSSQMNSIIESKQRELKLNKILNDIL